jgi:predicted AAA+ superfamily ATPase
MFPRLVFPVVSEALARQAAVALIGPRQVGKTTLALEIAKARPSLYLDLERPADRAKVQDPELFLRAHADKLVVLDEIHRAPEIFASLRGLIDEGRRTGQATGRFLLLGSASIDLLRQSSETLAGRVAFVEMAGLQASEIAGSGTGQHELWIRGGFPGSLLAAGDEASFAWRLDFIRTYLEREIAMFSPRVPAEMMRRLWTMLAHSQGGTLNASALAQSLGVSAPTVARYVDLLSDLLLVRRLPPFHANIGKRLVKSPKTFIRDSGLLHALLGLRSRDEVLAHPVAGHSWEGFVIEQLITAAPPRTDVMFFRSAAAAELDLVLELPGGRRWAVEIKLGLAPSIGKGVYHAAADVEATKKFVVYSGEDRYTVREGVEVLGLHEMVRELRLLSELPT